MIIVGYLRGPDVITMVLARESREAQKQGRRSGDRNRGWRCSTIGLEVGRRGHGLRDPGGS